MKFLILCQREGGGVGGTVVTGGGVATGGAEGGSGRSTGGGDPVLGASEEPLAGIGGTSTSGSFGLLK